MPITQYTMYILFWLVKIIVSLKMIAFELNPKRFNDQHIILYVSIAILKIKIYWIYR